MVNGQRQQADLQMATNDVTTTTSARWDLSGCDYAVLDVIIGARTHSTTAACALSVLTSNDTVVSNFATVVTDQSQTPGTAIKMVRYLIDTRTTKRYLRLTSTPGTVATADAIAITAVLHKSRQAVSADAAADLTASTNDTVVTVG